MSKRTLLERLQMKYGSWNNYNSTTNSNQNAGEPPLKKQRRQNSSENIKPIQPNISDSNYLKINKNKNNTIAINKNKNKNNKIVPENTNNSNKNIKQKKQKPIQFSLNSLKINNFIISEYVAQSIRVLFGQQIIAIQWQMAKQKACKSNYKLYKTTATKRINIKFDSIEYIYCKYSKLYLKLKLPPYFSEQACSNLRNSGQKSNQFYLIQNDPTNGNAIKYKHYKIELGSKVQTFMNKLQQKSQILKQAIANGAIQSNTVDNDIMFNSEQLKQNNAKIKQKINQKKSKHLSDGEVDKILMSLGVKRKECKGVNDCLRVAISKKYIGIKNGKCKLDKNGGLKQKINNLCWMPECMEITLERLIDQPLMGDDYECGDTQGAARCVDENCDGDYCGAIQYVTGLCGGKPKLEMDGSGKFHNHCKEKECRKCVGDYRSGHCYKCGVHDTWMGKCGNCDESD